MIDARYQNKKNGKVAVVVQEDAKYKTALIQYEDDGKEQEISFATLKRWWEELDEDAEVADDADEDAEEVDDDVDEEEDDEQDEDEEDLDEDDEFDEDEEDEIEDDEDDEDIEEDADAEEPVEDDEDEDELAGDGTPLKEVGKQIAEQAKQKAKKAKADADAKSTKKQKSTRQVKPENKENADIIDYLSSAIEKRGGSVQRHKTNYGNAGSYKVDGRRFGRYRSTKADVRIYFRYSLVKSLKKPVENYPNEPFGAEYIFTKLTREDKKLIDSLLDLAIKAQHDTNVQKAEKKNTKKETVKKQEPKKETAKKETSAKKAPAKKEPVKKQSANRTTKKK